MICFVVVVFLESFVSLSRDILALETLRLQKKSPPQYNNYQISPNLPYPNLSTYLRHGRFSLVNKISTVVGKLVFPSVYVEEAKKVTEGKLEQLLLRRAKTQHALPYLSLRFRIQFLIDDVCWQGLRNRLL